MPIFRKLKRAEGISLGDMVALVQSYGPHKIGDVGQVVRISRNQPYSLRVYDELKSGDWSVKRHKSGGATIKIHGVPKMLFGKPTSKLHFFKPETTFWIKVPFLDEVAGLRGAFCELPLKRSEITKVSKTARIGDRILR